MATAFIHNATRNDYPTVSAKLILTNSYYLDGIITSWTGSWISAAHIRLV